MSGRLQVDAPDGIGEVGAGDDLAALVRAHLDLVDGDVVVVTSKVVSKAEGRVVTGDRADAVAAQSTEVLARRGSTTIVRTHHGLVLAAAGVDASNVETGHLVLLPDDPDASARALRAALAADPGVRVGVVVTDTAGRAWREGQTDIAIGVAGLSPLQSFVGRTDAHGNDLVVTAPAVADEVAGAAELAQGKLGGRPLARVRGLSHLVLSEDGPGAAALVRAPGHDLFGYGAREAVVRAVAARAEDAVGFGDPAAPDELLDALARCLPGARPVPPTPTGATAAGSALHVTLQVMLPAGTEQGAVAAVCFAHGWELTSYERGVSEVVTRISRRTP